MKIAQIVCAFPPYRGGIGQSASILGAYLQEENKVHTFTLAPLDKSQSSRLPDTTYLRPLLRAGHGAFPFSLPLRLRNYDCFYLHYPFFGAAELVWLAKLLRPSAKLVIHYHMDVVFSSPILQLLSWPARLLRRSLLSRADAILISSLDYARHSAISKYLEKWPEKFHALPFPVDTSHFRPKLPENRDGSPLIAKAKEIIGLVTRNFIKRQRTHFLFVGGLDRAHYFKGVDVLLRSVAKLPAKKWHLSLIGEGDLKQSYISLAQELGLDKEVEFVGSASDDELVRRYQEADCFVLPSINSNEAFGIVLLEAMACGLPVIASDLPGVRSVFRTGQEGFFCPPGDVDALAQAMAKIIEDRALQERLGRAARAWAVEKYSQEVISEKLRRLFSSL